MFPSLTTDRDIQSLDSLALEELDTSFLSEEQRVVARKIITTRKSLLITGNAGTGKSALLNWVRSRVHMDVTASTGIAALQINGGTIHSWAGLGIGNKPAGWIVQNMLEKWLKYRDRTYDRIRHCQRLVIDEVSMLSADMLDLLDLVLCEVRECDEPFGGIQMILLGDALQLPPVTKGKEEPKFFFEAEAWRHAQVDVHLLTKVFRQEEELFARVLNKIRFDEIDEEVEDFLRSRYEALDPEPEIPPCIIHSHNAGCDRINRIALSHIQSPEVHFHATDEGKHSAFIEQLNKDCLAPKKLTLKVGARVMLLVNLDPGKRLVNGSLGIVTSFDAFGIHVEFDHGETVLIEKAGWSYMKGDDVLATREQYPLRLAYSITAHKSQGMTLSKVEAHLARCFADGQSYVALSRAQTSAGLFLRGDGINIMANKKAVDFYRRNC
jgi:ATP-dependent DNA helicase PIF1